MKKCVILISFVLFAVILCSCGSAKKENSEKTSSDISVTEPETASDSNSADNSDVEVESSDKTSSETPKDKSENGSSGTPATEPETVQNSNYSQDTGSQNQSDGQNNSGLTDIPEFSPGEYELPFIPK